MAADALMQFQAQTTKTSTFRGTGIPLPGGTPRRGAVARIIYSNASNASGANTVMFSVDVSRDNGGTWQQEADSDPITLTTTPQSGELFVAYRVVANVMALNAIPPLVALSCNITGAGASPTITYVADNVTGGPA